MQAVDNVWGAICGLIDAKLDARLGPDPAGDNVNNDSPEIQKALGALCDALQYLMFPEQGE